jgi:subtilase family serine protease
MPRSFHTAVALSALLVGIPLAAQAAPGGVIGRPAATQPVTFSVHLPLREEAQLDRLIHMQSDPHSPLYRHYLSVAQFRATFGAAPETVARTAAALRARGFAIVKQTSQGLRASGAALTVERAFATRLSVVRDTAGRSRLAFRSAFTTPPELTALGANVVGFEPSARAHVDSYAVPANRNGPFGGYHFDDLKQAYAYPADTALDGAGATIGVMMASDVLDSDTQAQLDHEKYTAISGKLPLPLIRRPVLGGAPFDITSGESYESSIDVQTSLGSAPGAQIVLYNIPSLGDDAIFAGYTDVVEDNLVDVLSSSFGACELFYTAAYNGGVDYTGVLKAQSALFKQGESQGITFIASSGDNAGLGCTTVSYFSRDPSATFIPGVEYPASDPNVVSVGGTNLKTAAPPSPEPSPPALNSQYVSENAYADKLVAYDPYGLGSNVSGGYWGSGSGPSAIFGKPWYQYLISTPTTRRTVPDVSMQMGGCPSIASSCNPGDSYSLYYIGGSQYGFVGTSLSAPEFAGLLAVKIGLTHVRLGNANGYVYEVARANDSLPPSFPTRYFHQGIAGFNGVVNAAGGVPGYNPIIGVGTPYGADFIGVPQDPLAGNPQTLSNP